MVRSSSAKISLPFEGMSQQTAPPSVPFVVVRSLPDAFLSRLLGLGKYRKGLEIFPLPQDFHAKGESKYYVSYDFIFYIVVLLLTHNTEHKFEITKFFLC